MKTFKFKIFMIPLMLGSAWAASPESMQPHPLLGKWSWTYAKNNCSEHYEYFRDGRSAVTSGDEVVQSEYQVDSAPDPNGFYRMTDVVVVSNGRTGCDGNPGGTPVGDKATNFILFNPARDKMVLCERPNLSYCMGPLNRMDR